MKRYLLMAFLAVVFFSSVSLISYADSSEEYSSSDNVESSSEFTEEEITYEPQFSSFSFDLSADTLVSWSPEDLEDVIDVPAALDSLDDEIFVAGNGFKIVFNKIVEALSISSLLILLLVTGIILRLIGR